jgi:hypothetical protein
MLESVELIVAISTAKSPVAIVHKVTVKLPNSINCLGGADYNRSGDWH